MAHGSDDLFENHALRLIFSTTDLTFLAMWNPIASLLRSMTGGKPRPSNTPESPDSEGKPKLPTAEATDAPLPKPSDPVAAQDVPRPYREHAKDYRRTKVNVATAVINILGENADGIGPELMAVGGGLRKFPPIAGNFGWAALRLLCLWAALHHDANSNRASCLHLVDRCATILMTIREGVAQAGDDLIPSGLGVNLVVADLECAFMEIRFFLCPRGFFKRRFQRDQTRREARRCDDRLTTTRGLYYHWLRNYVLETLLDWQIKGERQRQRRILLAVLSAPTAAAAAPPLAEVPART